MKNYYYYNFFFFRYIRVAGTDRLISLIPADDKSLFQRENAYQNSGRKKKTSRFLFITIKRQARSNNLCARYTILFDNVREIVIFYYERFLIRKIIQNYIFEHYTYAGHTVLKRNHKVIRYGYPRIDITISSHLISETSNILNSPSAHRDRFVYTRIIFNW